LIKAINPQEEITEYRYTERDNLESVTDHYGQSTSYSYDDQDRLLSVTDALGKQVLTQVYDAEGRLISRRDGIGNTVSYEYAANPSGRGFNYRPSKITYPTYERYLTYDRAHRLTRDAVVLDGEDGRVESYAYDQSGNLIRYTNADGQAATYAYDALNRPYAYTSPLGESIRVVYDNRDNIVAVTDPRGNTTRYSYDRSDRVTSEINPLGETIRYAYDPSGNTVEITDAKGQRRVYAYDQAHQLESARYFETGEVVPAQEVELSYDGVGRYLTWDDGFASARYAYDKVGRLLSETIDYGGLRFNQSNSYYENGLIETYTDPEGRVSTFDFDPGNRISSIDLPGVGIVSINQYYWLAPERITLPGGMQQVYRWSDLLELENLIVQDPAATMISQLDYSYNKLGFIESRRQDGLTTHYGYDGDGRLTTVESQGSPARAFERDAIGNRVSSENGVSRWVYNELNQLESRPGVTYDYDAAGNLLSKTDNGIVTRYVYDMLHRLVRVEDEAGKVIAEYGYDPFDHRIWKEVNGARTYYVYAGEGLVGEYDDSGNPLVSYGYWPSSPWSTNPVYQRSGDDYAFFHTDHLSTPTLLTDVNGNVVWSASYDVDGNATISSASTITNNFRFPGQYYDAETGLHYNLRRYYDPAIGRYITSDPIGVAGGLNQYLYAGGNPVRFFDPRGECVLVGAAAGVAVLGFKSWFCNVEYGWSSYVQEALYGAACKADDALDLLRIARKRRPDPPNKTKGQSSRDDGAGNQPCKASNSFTDDTLVHTEAGLKPIRDIEVGDRVLAYSEWTGETSHQAVTSVHAGESKYDIVTVTLISGELIEATAGHPIYIFEKGWLSAAELKRGDRVVTDDLIPMLIKSVDSEIRAVSVNNLSIANARTFFVGTSGVLVHNSQSSDKCRGAKRRFQNPKDITVSTEYAARREAMRRHGGPVSGSNNFKRVDDWNKNKNIRGPNGEPAEFLDIKDLYGNDVRIDYHKWGHRFEDNNTYEYPHYHGPDGEHISYPPGE
jgi:RHS repeat-associated protein